VTIRCLNQSQIESDLKAIYDITLAAFHDAFLFCPIDFESYLNQVWPLVEQVDPQWVLLAEQNDVVVGFVFGAPDLLQSHTKETIDTVILKTLAVRPRRDLAGLGMLLLQRFHDTASEQGYQRVIHALMHLENGLSCSLSARYSKPVRHYGLFAKELC
jgi:predicted N-acetyltransferase YhbS